MAGIEEDALFQEGSENERNAFEEDFSKHENMSADDMSKVVDNGMTQNSEVIFGNRVKDTSSAKSQTILDNSLEECEGTENKVSDIDDDVSKNDGFTSKKEELPEFENNMAGIEKGLNNNYKNSSLEHDGEIKQNSGTTIKNVLVEKTITSKTITSHSRKIIVERSSGSRKCKQFEFDEDVKNDVARSRDWVQVETNLINAGEDINSDLNSRPKDGHEMEQGTDIPVSIESYVGDPSQTNVEDGLMEDNQDKLVKIDIEDGLKSDGLRTTEYELVENNSLEIEETPEMTFLEIESNLKYIGNDVNSDLSVQPLKRNNEMENSANENHGDSTIVEDPSTSGEKGESTFADVNDVGDDLKNDELSSIECKVIESSFHEIGKNPEMTFVQIESNLAYMGGSNYSNMPLEHGDSVEQNGGILTENNSVKDSEVVEDVLNRTEPTDTKSDNADMNTEGDLKSNDVKFDNKLAQSPETIFENHLDEDSAMDKRRIEDALKSVGFENVEDNLLDFNIENDLKNDDFTLQIQHEKEMHELRLTLQDEYQKQVAKISDELREHYQNELDERIGKLEEEWELEFVKQKREYDEQVSAVQREQSTQCQEAIERVTLDAEDQLKNMKNSYERETAEHKQRIRELLEREALWEIKEKELANEKSQKENESLDKIKKLENQLSFEREEVESQLHGAEDEIETLKKQHEIEIGNLTNELDKKYGDIVDAMRQELKSKYQDEMDRKVNQVESHLREQYQQDLEKNKEEIQESTSTLKTKYEKQVAEVLAQLEELHERNQQHELREATLKKNFENEKRKVAELLKEAEDRIETVRELEQQRKDLKSMEKKFKQCLDEKSSLEEKVKEYSESTAKDTKDLQEELTKKSELIRELEQLEKDSKSKCEDLLQKLQNITEEKVCMEKKLNEDLISEKVNVEALQKELETKEQEIIRLQLDEKEYHQELEKKVHETSQEKLCLEEALKTRTEKEKVENLQEELQKEQGEKKESIDDVNDAQKNSEYKLREMTTEKKSLEQQLADSKSEMSSLQLKLTEDEKMVNELKSNYDAKISQITKKFEEEVNALESELKRKKNSEEEAVGLKKDVSNLNEEISKLNDDLQKHKATISELEETGRCRDLEIANLILNSASPQSLGEKAFDFSANSADRAQELENELAKYKKKVQELEEEAEDKFETTVCPNCQDREKSEEILLQTKALVDKIQQDCQKKVQNVSKDLEEAEKALQEQIKETEDLKVKLVKAEDDLSEERKRSLEISKLGKNFDVNGNVLGRAENSKDIPDTADAVKKDQMEPLKSLQTERKQNDDVVQDKGNATKLPKSKDFESLLDEQEKFYKTEITKKDDDILHLMTENEKIQQQVQDLKQKSKEGENQREQLIVRTLEQKKKYENEINLMQNEIKVLIRENNELKEQLEIFQNIQEENENLRTKLQESENAVQATFLETKNVQANLQETENMLKENSRKYEREIVTLKGAIQEKENYIADLRNALELLEKSREELELDISNQTQQFSERERSLINEIQEMRSAFENEKTKSLEDNSFEKEEKNMRLDFREMFINEHNNFDRTERDTDETSGLLGDIGEDDRDSLPNESMDIKGYKGVNTDNLPKETIDFRGYEGVNGGNLSMEQKGNVRNHERENWDNLLREQAVDSDINGYEGVPKTRSRNAVQYEEINFPSNGFKRNEEAMTENTKGILKGGRATKQALQSDGIYKQGSEATWGTRHDGLNDSYSGFDDTEYDGSIQDRSPDSLFSDEKYKEIGSEENLELLKYEHDIDMLLERKENERLREEIRTLANCVEVFHDECETLKKSLDKTLSIVEILRDERDGLMKEHDLNMAEHSELVLDLIKYEETISRLEKGNEKLEDDRKLLEECLMEKQGMLSPVGKQAMMPYKPKTESNRPTKDDRFQSERQAHYDVPTGNQPLFSSYPKGMELGSEIDEFSRSNARFLRQRNEYPNNEAKFVREREENQKYETRFLGRGNELQRNGIGFLRKRDEFESTDADILKTDNDALENRKEVVLEDGVKEAELKTRIFHDRDNEDILRRLPTRGESFDPEKTFRDDFKSLKSDRTEDTKARRQAGSTKDSEILHKGRVDFVGTWPGVDIIQGVKDTQTCLLAKKSNTGNVLNNSKRSYEEHRIPTERAKLEKSWKQTSPKMTIPPHTRQQQSTIDIKSHPSTKHHEKPKFKRSPGKGNEKQTSKSKNALAVLPTYEYVSRDVFEVPRNATPPSRVTKRTSSSRIREHKQSRKSDPRDFSPKPKRVSRSSLSNVSTMNSQNFSGSSILTSTRANMTTSDRLIPNLSGLSPIVSPVDRHYHSEKLKWQISEKDHSNIVQTDYDVDNTTFLLNADPNALLQTPGTENRERFRSKTRARSRTADARLKSSNYLSSSRDLHEEKPLLINFEDFIFRHRVKSSEDVASIRDPSPAELWFS